MTVPTLKLKVRKKAVVKGRALVRFPANVETLAFLTVARANGVYTFGADFKRLDEAHVSDPTAVIVALFDLNTGGFKQATLASLMPIASQSEAQTGSDNTKTMTPLRVKQSIASEVGVSIASKSQGDLADSALQVDDIGDSVQGYDANLADIAGLSPDDNDLLQRKSGAWTNRTPAQVKTDLVLNNVDNTSDANKPVSTATQTALDAKANTSDLATVATSGSYDDLTDQPTIPAAGLPTGGATGQVLAKSSGTDYAVNWSDAGAGDLISTNNLSDVADAQTSAMNLGLYDFDTKADAEAATIPSVRACLRIGGYAAVGDGGGALYARVGSEPSHDGKFQSADGAWWELSETQPNEPMFGAVPSATDAVRTAAIASLFVYANGKGVPAYIDGSHTITSNINMPDNLFVYGHGSYGQQLSLGFAGAMFTVGSGVRIYGLSCAGQGASFTGSAFNVTGAGDQVIQDCFVTDFVNPCLTYGFEKGIRAIIRGGQWSRHTATDPAIVCSSTAETVGARIYDNLQCGGGVLVDLGGSNDVDIHNCGTTNIIFSANTKKVRAVGNRIANGAIPATLTLAGIQHSFTGNIISGDVAVGSTNTGWDETNIIVGSLTDTSGSYKNIITCGPLSYTPVWSAASTAPSIGNGSLFGEYERDGVYCIARVIWAPGSTTTFGSGIYNFSLPLTPLAHGIDIEGSAYALKSGVSFYSGVAILGNSSTNVALVLGSSPSNFVTQSVPATWASGDYIKFTIRYKVAATGNQ